MSSQTTDESIVKKQNEEHFLRCFSAQKKTYSRAKLLRRIYFIVIVIISSVLAVLTEKMSTELWNNMTLLFSVLNLFIAPVLELSAQKMQNQGAAIQQYIDVSLFAKNKEYWGEIIPDSKIKELVASFPFSEKDKKAVKNWYGNYSSNHYEQVANCQLENVRWNRKLTNAYRIAVIAFFSLFCIVLGTLCVFLWKPSFISMLSVISCCLSFIQYFIKWIIDFKSSSELRQKTEEMLHSYLQNKNEWDNEGWEMREIRIQNRIFEIRKSSVSAPDWFYHLFRNRYEKQEKDIAKQTRKKK